MPENYVQLKNYDLQMGKDQLDAYDMAAEQYKSYQTPMAENYVQLNFLPGQDEAAVQTKNDVRF